MTKMNNRGFLLAESLIVSTFVLTVLIFLFVQFRNLMVNHRQSYIYNNVEDIYTLGSIADEIRSSEQINNLKGNEFVDINPTNNSYCHVTCGQAELEKLIYTDSDLSKIKNNNKFADLDQDLKDFINKVKTNKVAGKGRLIAKFSNGHFATIAVETIVKKGYYVSKDGIDQSADGTISNPYKTIQAAYNSISDNNAEEVNIYIMNNIEESDANFSANKKAKITSLVGTRTITRNDGNKSVLNISNGNITLENINISGGSGTASGININTYGTLSIGKKASIKNFETNGNGGAINSSGNININGGTISNNKGVNGGAIYLTGGTLNVSSGTISNNTSTANNNITGNGGGIYIESGNAILNGGNISNNKSLATNVKSQSSNAGNGGGIYLNNGTLTINSGSIINNNANGYTGQGCETNTETKGYDCGRTGYGGGIFANATATITIKGGKTNNNNASSRGGGIYTFDELNIENGSISGNSAGNSGGGIQNGTLPSSTNSVINISGGTISNNKANDYDAGGINAEKLTISGGNITENSANNFGGGLKCRSDCTITGGKITDNKAINHAGGGIWIYDNATLKINGSATVKDNTDKSNNKTANYYMTNNAIIKQNNSLSISTSDYRIAAYHNNNFVLDVDGGGTTKVQLWTWLNGVNQKWKIAPYNTVDGITYYYMTSNRNNDYKYLEAAGDGSGVNSRSATEVWNIIPSNAMFNDQNQTYGDFFWSLEDAGGDYYYLKTYKVAQDRHFCIDVDAGKMANGTKTQMWPCENNNNQKWKIIKL